LRASMFVGVATEPQVAGLSVVADSRHDWAQIVGQNVIAYLQRVLVMGSAKTIVTLASAAVVGCSIFAFSWVGLALLGF
jgi:hypothetical protein